MTVWALCFSGQACSTPPLGPSSPYQQIDGSLEIHDWEASFSCVVQTCTLTWRKGTHVFTRVHRPRYWQLSLNVPPPQYLAERSERDLTDVLTLIWRFVPLQAGVSLVSRALPAYCPSVTWHQLEKTWNSVALQGVEEIQANDNPREDGVLELWVWSKTANSGHCSNKVRMLWIMDAADSPGVCCLTCLMLPALRHILIHVSGSAYIPYINSVNTLPRPEDDDGCY